MGCDIHLHAEIKVCGVWHHYSKPQITRHYILFERMAGVRGDVENAIAAPRGVPDDATFTTRYDFDHYGSDAHSASWLGAEEISMLVKYAEEMKKILVRDWYSPELEEFGFLFGNGLEHVKRYPDSYPKGLEDFRWVFWFDN